MNHWFLVGRDFMWLLVAVFPLVASYMTALAHSDGEFDMTSYLFAAIISQAAILNALYFGVIR